MLTPIAKAVRELLGPFRDLNGEAARLAVEHGKLDFTCLMARIGSG